MKNNDSVSANLIADHAWTVQDFAAYYNLDAEKVCEYLNVSLKSPAREIGEPKLKETLQIFLSEDETEPEIWFPHFISNIDQPPLVGEIDPPPLATRLYQKP